MKVLLIENSCPDTRALGVRSLSAYLTHSGHNCQLLFLPPGVERMSAGTVGPEPYPSYVIDAVVEAASQSDLVGISLLSYYYELGVQLSEAIRNRTGKPVIWGGYHAMGDAAGSLKHADFVCIGEGEVCLSKLVDNLENGDSIDDVPNLVFMKSGKIQINEVHPLFQNLSELPFLDYRLNHHLIWDRKSQQIRELDRDCSMSLAQLGPMSYQKPHYHYQTYWSRGCLHNCSYCCETVYRELYPRQRLLRRRSPERVVEEILYWRENQDYISAIAFSDNSFTDASDEAVLAFAEQYKSKVALPFSAQFSPGTLNPIKMDALVDAGLRYVEVGVQTAGTETQRLYRRPLSNDDIMKCCRMLNKYTDRIMPPDYHFIVDNPWEPMNETIDTIKLISKIPKPRGIKVSSLVFYPGTALWQKAINEGMFTSETREKFRKNFGALSPSPLNLLFFLSDMDWIPSGLIRLLAGLKLFRNQGKIAQSLTVANFGLFSLLDRIYRKIKRTIKR